MAENLREGGVPEADEPSDTVRLRLDLAYQGGNFYGWARQPSLRTVQGCLEEALALVTHQRGKRAGSQRAVWNPRLVVAGRTDTGVHASHQVCHLDMPRPILESCRGHMDVDPAEALKRRLRHLLPSDIALHDLGLAPTGFDARFSALERTYVYRVCDRPEDLDPRMRGFVLPVDGHLDLEAMNQAVGSCLGLHDFGSFATANEGGTTIRKVLLARWDRVERRSLIEPSAKSIEGAGSGRMNYDTPMMESGLVCFTIVADAFAHNMVRSLVNASLRVGLGKRSVSWFADKVEHPVREGSTGPIAACGLTLEHVQYPPDDQLAARAASIRARRTL